MSEMSGISDISASEDQTDYVSSKNEGKKKLKNITFWKKNVRKAKRSLGEEYTSLGGKKVPKRVFQFISKCCSKEWVGKIDVNAQKNFLKSSRTLAIKYSKIQQDFTVVCRKSIKIKRECWVRSLVKLI